MLWLRVCDAVTAFNNNFKGFLFAAHAASEIFSPATKKGAHLTYLSSFFSSLNMCTVSVLLDAARNKLSALNANDDIATHLQYRLRTCMRLCNQHFKFYTSESM